MVTRLVLVRSRSRGLSLPDVREGVRASGAVVLGSVAREVDPSLVSAFHRAHLVVAAQGYLREWSADGTVRPRAWEDASEVVRVASATVLSEEDVAGELAQPRRWATHGTVIVTLGERGALVLSEGGETTVGGCVAARVVDQTGTGAAFAAGLALGLAEDRSLLDAVRFANAVASFAVEGVGTDGLGDREAVEARLRG